MARANFQLSYAELSPPDQDLLNHPSSGYLRTLQLYPAFSHELFVEGYRYEVVQGQASSILRDGAFKRLCRDAAARPHLSWCLILDDIHRCDVAALFGETLHLLGTRNERVWLPASGDTLSLSERVLIIATGQLSALKQLDPVLLRHFSTLELAPDLSVLPELVLADGRRFSPANWLGALNERIVHKLGDAGAAEAIGQGYFFSASQPPLNFADWQQRLRYRVWPRLTQLARLYGFSIKDLVGSMEPHAEEAALIQSTQYRFPEAFL